MTTETVTAPGAWIDVGAADELATWPLQQVLLGRKKIALVCKDSQFSAISGVCNHAGGPLGEGKLDGDYVVCPWHYWKFHCRTGEGEPGFEERPLQVLDGSQGPPRRGVVAVEDEAHPVPQDQGHDEGFSGLAPTQESQQPLVGRGPGHGSPPGLPALDRLGHH